MPIESIDARIDDSRRKWSKVRVRGWDKQDWQIHDQGKKVGDKIISTRWRRSNWWLAQESAETSRLAVAMMQSRRKKEESKKQKRKGG